MRSKERIEKAKECIDTIVDDVALREQLQKVVSGLDILVSCIEPGEFAEYIQKCVDSGDSKPIRKPLREMLFGQSYTWEEEEDRKGYELELD